MGSGYDSIGIALELYNVIDLAENDHIDISDKNGQYLSLIHIWIRHTAPRSIWRSKS